MDPLQISWELKNNPASISVSCPQFPGFSVQDATIEIYYKRDRRQRKELLSLTPTSQAVTDLKRFILPFETDQWETFRFSAGESLAGDIHIVQDTLQRFVCVKMEVKNISSSAIHLDKAVFLGSGQTFRYQPAAQSQSPELQDDIAFYSNGWQSWSFSGVYGQNEKQKKSLLRFIPNAVSSYPETPYLRHKGHFSSDFFGVLGSRRCGVGLLAGFLSQKEQFGSLESTTGNRNSLQAWANFDGVCLEPGKLMETDWFLLSFMDITDPDAMQIYYELVARHHGIQVSETIPTGWCSWYQFFTHITAEKMTRNIEQLAAIRSDLPVQLIQIDDGFQASGGDWFQFNKGFPEGVAPLAAEILDRGFMPGLWLAPFIVSKDARLLHERPDLILKNRLGRPVNSGFISEKFSTALDLSYKPALEYACDVVRTAAQNWGFPYLKLDFLYAGALPGERHDRTKTRAQILRNGLEAIRAVVGDSTYLLGCGAPLGSALGVFDAMRIGADTDIRWKPKLFNLPLLLKNDPQLPSTRNAIQNTITRAGMHKTWWVNDPDCLLVRPETELSLEELQAHATLIAMSGGSLMLSDDLPGLPEVRKKIAEVLIPLMGKRPLVMDWFSRLTPQRLRLDLQGALGSWQLLACFNWKDHPEECHLFRKDYMVPPGPLWVHSFWDSVSPGRVEGDLLWRQILPAHGVLLLAVRPDTNNAQYLGSNLHISQGMEVTAWEHEHGELNCLIDVGRNLDGSIFLSLPNEPGKVLIDQQPVLAQRVTDGIFCIHIRSAGRSKLVIRNV